MMRDEEACHEYYHHRHPYHGYYGLAHARCGWQARNVLTQQALTHIATSTTLLITTTPYFAPFYKRMAHASNPITRICNWCNVPHAVTL